MSRDFGQANMRHFAVFIVLVMCSSADAIFLRHIFQDWYHNQNGDGCEGSCQLSMTCWINGGQVNGTCGGYVYSCCKYNKSQRQGQTYAQPRKLEFWDEFEVNNIETLQDVHYGPVRNDPVCGLQRISRRRVVGRLLDN